MEIGMATTSRTAASSGRRPQEDPCGWTWHNYALCRWLAFRDDSAAEEMFVRAIQGDPHNKVIQENFDYFLSKKYPNQPEMSSADVVRRHATAEMLKDVEIEQARLEKMHADPAYQAATLRVQMAWRRQFFNEVLGRDKGKHQALLEAAAAVEESSSSSSSESSDSEEERLRGRRALRWERAPTSKEERTTTTVSRVSRSGTRPTIRRKVYSASRKKVRRRNQNPRRRKTRRTSPRARTRTHASTQ